MHKAQLSISMFCAVLLSIPLSAMDDTKNVMELTKVVDTEKIDQFLGWETHDQRFTATHSFLGLVNYGGWISDHGFKALSVGELANSIVRGDNIHSRDENPFELQHEEPIRNKVTNWSDFCSKEWEFFRTNKLSTKETIDFLVLCGQPMVSAINHMHQVPHYQGFVEKVTASKLALQKLMDQE